MKASRLFRVRPGQFVYNRMFVTEGSFALVAPDHGHGVVSNEFPVFDLDESRIEPAFLLAYFQQPSVWRAVADQATGTTKSRRRWKEAQFLTHSIALPPLDEQRRIVDLIAAVDDTTAAAEGEARALGNARRALIDALIATHDTGKSAKLGQLGTFERGRRFTKKDYVSDGLGCIHYGEIYTSFGATAIETISFLPESFRGRSRLAQTGDLIIAGTGENVEDIGKAVAWLGNDDVAVHDDAYIYRHSLDPMYASALFASRVVLSQRAPSDSKVARLSSGALANMTVPLVPAAAQKQIGATMVAIDVLTSAARATADAMRALRSNLLTVLLSGEHAISESYDRFLEEAAA